jgi:hypothetical protein
METTTLTPITEEAFKKSKYTDAHRQAQQKYREKNREAYNKSQRELYAKLHQSEEWKNKFNERSAKNNLSYRENKKIKALEANPNIVFRGRGRPRNPSPIVI